MAQPIVSPENLSQAVEEIKDYIDHNTGASDFVYISSVIDRTDVDENDNKLHRLYLALPLDFDITGVTLQFARKNKIKYRKQEEEATRKTASGWHRIIDHREEDKYLLDNLILKVPDEDSKLTNWNNKKLYEVIVDGYDSLTDYLFSDPEAQTSGYYEDKSHSEEIPLYKFLYKSCGIALVKNGKIISNYARFSGYINPDTDLFNLRRL